MAKVHNLGFPRVGSMRELKFAQEGYWSGKSTKEELLKLASEIRKINWDHQKSLDLVAVGDFSLYDQVLDMSFTLGNIPQRARNYSGDVLDNYFRVARGRSVDPKQAISAAEMTKWFDTNYHYMVPEFEVSTTFKLDATRIIDQITEAKNLGLKPKPVIIGPVTYLAIGKEKDNSNKLDLLPKLLDTYVELLEALVAQNIEWVQIDEPILVTELSVELKKAFEISYAKLNNPKLKILLATYFGSLQDNLETISKLPIAGLHIDAVNGGAEVDAVISKMSGKVISLGVVNGRNIWKSDLNAILDWVEPIAKKLGDNLWIAPSCSLLHVPVDLSSEKKLDSEISSWLAFAIEKIKEIEVITTAINSGRAKVENELTQNKQSLSSRKNSTRVHNPSVQAELAKVDASWGMRKGTYLERQVKQLPVLNLPKFPTTTIGSFPQTGDIRSARSKFKSGEITENAYQDAMRKEIIHSIKEQESLGLDVLVHGEAERNDMVEYFGEQLQGYAFSQFGWVQSYGSRCVKPPILFGDISRPKAMTVEWIKFAQSQTLKIMKGMLTGPVTILNWSFVRDDQPRSTSCAQLALAIRQEVLDLEKAGIKVIQIDEAALREGLPLRKSQWKEYLDWAVGAFRIAANGVGDQTQIHTHMCYSEFNDIISSIADMDTDVITIETSRSDMELLDAFDSFKYPNEIGPGVYDIHSPNIPTQEHIVSLMQKAAQKIPAERLWVNPDCGLKTRQWSEVTPALTNMVAAAKTLRSQLPS